MSHTHIRDLRSSCEPRCLREVLVNQPAMEMLGRSDEMPYALEAKSARDNGNLKPIGLTLREKIILAATP